MESDTEEASDTGTFSPETLVVETSAMDIGTTVDDQDYLTDYDYDLSMMTPSVQCKPCARRNKSVLALRQFDRYTKEQHTGVRIMLRCSRYGKSFRKIHATECHIPKCKGAARPRLVFQCELCPDIFGTAIGRSQHERHAHPELRNRRRQEAAETPAGRPGRTLTMWTQEETDLLLTLDRRFQEDWRIKILEFLPRKTRKQISDKHVHLGLTNRTAPMTNDNDLEPSPTPTDPTYHRSPLGNLHQWTTRCPLQRPWNDP